MRDRAAWIAVGVPILLLTAVGIVTGRAPLEGDLLVYQLPIYEVLSDAARAGRIPWWDPTVQSGTPFFANPQTQLLWPPTWVHAVLPAGSALMAWLLLHGLLAGAGALLWLKARGLDAASSAIGALVFTLGGPALSLVTKPDKLPAYALLPWLLLGLQAWAEGRRRRAVALVVGAQVGMAVSGGLEVWILALGAAVCLMLGSARRHARGIPWLLLSTVVAFAIAGVQLLPFLDLMAHSTRSAGIDYAAVARWSLVPADLVELAATFALQPDLPGTAELGRIRFLGHVGAGSVALVALVAWAAPGARGRGPTGETAAILLALVGFGLLAVGDATPIHRVAYDVLPPLKSLRYPEKYLWGAWPFVALAASRGASRLRAGEVSGRLVAILCAVAFGAAAVIAPPAYVALSALIATASLSWRSRPALVVGVAAVELMLLARVMLPPMDVEAVVAQGERVDEPVPRYFNVDRHLDKRTPLPPRTSAEQRLTDVSARAWPNVGVLRDADGRRRFEYADGVRAIRLERQDLYFDHVAPQAVPNALLLLRRAGVEALGFLSEERLRAWTSVAGIAAEFTPPHTVVPVSAFRRVGWARSAQRFADDAEVYRALGGAELLEGRRLALLDGDPGVAEALARQAPPKEDAPELVVERPVAERFDVEVAGVGGWLVVREAWAPGWTAEIEAQGSVRSVPVARADFYLMAIPIPIVEGGETVRIRLAYRPSRMGIGLILSVLGLTSFLAALGILGRR